MNDLERRFLHHAPTSQAVVHSHELTRQSFLSMARIVEQLPDSRERACAMTRLEEASFWMHAAIARGQVAYPSIIKSLADSAPEAEGPAQRDPKKPVADVPTRPPLQAASVSPKVPWSRAVCGDGLKADPETPEQQTPAKP